jgi:hypothetical protein
VSAAKARRGSEESLRRRKTRRELEEEDEEEEKEEERRRVRGHTKRMGISSGSACAIQMMRGRISWRKWPYEVG